MRPKAPVAILLSSVIVAGCTPVMFPREIGDSARAIVVSATDQAIWEKLVASVDGQVIEPGIEGYAGVLYVAGGKLTGVSGRVAISGDGHGGGNASAAALSKIRDIMSTRPELGERILAFIKSQIASGGGSSGDGQ